MSNATLHRIWADPRGLTLVPFRIQGAGAATPTLEEGTGLTVAYVATGQYRITFEDSYPALYGICFGLEAATPGDLAGHTVIADTISAKVQDFFLYSQLFAAHDLAANEYIVGCAFFRNTANAV